MGKLHGVRNRRRYDIIRDMKTNHRNTLALALAGLGWAVAPSIIALADGNPMQFPSYVQTVSAEFANAQQANDAKLLVAPLPGGASVACSCRWEPSKRS